ncbi:hypothetical protein O181_005538 [Austropuccinia psidii MF-1]|uniref:TM7S3/TM198-like domain-containing protein n=1 Tax=Austropuccinia psidii MF-1 TaxID=1389203 RepID=A0A9Q3BIQ1_9BASI|nr:hypothetical protein [Austropuccinia psidii MF-1]
MATSDSFGSADMELSATTASPATNASQSLSLAADGSLPSLRSPSLILQALLPLLFSIVLLLGGRRLYRFTTTVSVSLSASMLAWVLLVNLETGTSIGGWDGEVAAVTVWSTMIGAGLLGAILGYQYTWWGAHVTGRLCLGANAGFAFALSILLFQRGLSIHNVVGQWSFLVICGILGIVIILCDHVVGPLIAIVLCGGFLFLLSVDLFTTLGEGGVSVGLRYLLDHNPDHPTLLIYDPAKSTKVFIVISWILGLVSFGFQYLFYSVPFGPLMPLVGADEEQGLPIRAKESIMGTLENDSKKNHEASVKLTEKQARGTFSDISQDTSKDFSLESSAIMANSSDSRSLNHFCKEITNDMVALTHRGPPQLALPTSVYSRYRRTPDSDPRPHGRSAIQLNHYRSNLSNLNQMRRVETVDELTEVSTSVGGEDATARSSILTMCETTERMARANSVSEEYLHAMMRLAAGEDNNDSLNNEEKKETVVTELVDDEAKSMDNKDEENCPVATESNSNTNLPSELLAGNVTRPEITKPGDSAHPMEHNHSNSGLLPDEAPASGQSGADGVSNNHTQSDGKRGKFELNMFFKPLPRRPSSRSSLDQALLSTNMDNDICDEDVEEGEKSLLGIDDTGDISKGFDFPLSSSSQFNQQVNQFKEDGLKRIQSFKANIPSESLNVWTPEVSLQKEVNDCFDSKALKKFSHRPLPRLPSGTNGASQHLDDQSSSQLMNSDSLKSQDSFNSSVVDAFLRAGPDSSVPTTPSVIEKPIIKLKEEKQNSEPQCKEEIVAPLVDSNHQSNRASHPSLSINQPESKSFESSSSGRASAIPHTPILGSMILRVSEAAEKYRDEGRVLNHESDPVSSTEPLANIRKVAAQSEPKAEKDQTAESSRPTTGSSSLYPEALTNSDDEDRSSSRSYDSGEIRDLSWEFPRPQRVQGTQQGWSPVIERRESQEDDSSQFGSGGPSRHSPSLHSIPLPSRASKLFPHFDPPPQYSGNVQAAPPAPFVGQPLEQVPWPQPRPTQFTEMTRQSQLDDPQKRWTTASSIFPPLVYESASSSFDSSNFRSFTGPDDDEVAVSETETDRLPSQVDSNPFPFPSLATNSFSSSFHSSSFTSLTGETDEHENDETNSDAETDRLPVQATPLNTILPQNLFNLTGVSFQPSHSANSVNSDDEMAHSDAGTDRLTARKAIASFIFSPQSSQPFGNASQPSHFPTSPRGIGNMAVSEVGENHMPAHDFYSSTNGSSVSFEETSHAGAAFCSASSHVGHDADINNMENHDTTDDECFYEIPESRKIN